MKLEVAVVGAGVGGLTAAVALERCGFEVNVYERAPELRRQGSGLSLYTNAVAALRDMGLADVLEGISEPVGRMVVLSSTGGVLTEVDMEPTARRFSAPNVNVHRGGLLAALQGALPGETVMFGAWCVGFEQDTEGVRLRFADGAKRRADVLVAADGAGSAVRKAIHGNQEAEDVRRWSGWQGVSPSRPAGVPGGPASSFSPDGAWRGSCRSPGAACTGSSTIPHPKRPA